MPEFYDYVAVFLTDICHLACRYCITRHHGAMFGLRSARRPWLTGKEWAAALDRLELPHGVPVTIQGGEPFLHPGVWDLLNETSQKVDILTALPEVVDFNSFKSLKSLGWNRKDAPYPAVRVSYHKGQHDFSRLVRRVAALNQILSIGIFAMGEPIHSQDELKALWREADSAGVEIRLKEYLGLWRGKRYGDYQYPEAVRGKANGRTVMCRNSVAVFGPDGAVYRCHSDLYFGRRPLGSITDPAFEFPTDFAPCSNFGLCNECDVKIKTNSAQRYPYTSVEIKFEGSDSQNRVQ